MVFIRFSGCNRACSFCDTQHKENTEMSVGDIVKHVEQFTSCKRVLITGGEPMLQKEGLHVLSLTLAAMGYIVHLETNGDFLIDPSEVDWLTVSPKGPEWKQKSGDEIKLVFLNQSKADLDKFLLSTDEEFFRYHFLQPCSSAQESNVKEVVEYIKADPRWQLSLQTHKLIGVR
jgi:organic radical activating enzyme